MKKILIAVLIAILALGAAVGITLGVKSIKDDEGAKHNIEYDLTLLEDTYNKGDLVMFKVVVTADVELTSLTYKLNNGEEVVMTVKTGDADDLEDKVGSGKYFIDSGVELIDTAEMAVGHYVLAIYGKDAEGTTYNITDPVIFEIKSTTAN